MKNNTTNTGRTPLLKEAATALLALLPALSVPAPAMAQGKATDLLSSKQEISVGIGVGQTLVDALATPFPDGLRRDTPMEEYNNSKYSPGQSYTGCAYDLSYRRKLGKHWYAGAYVAFRTRFQNARNIQTGLPVNGARTNILTLMPSLRYYYRDTPKMRWYSEIAIGGEAFWERKMRESSFKHTLQSTAHITYIGTTITLGGHFFMFGELGEGNIGILRCGAGYRF
ncbi:MAG: hypothetical protein PUH24_08845 [Prevotellaceae bacterium]|nr:hypothetical protein [Prevotellaceae bacterium]MDY6129911.1 hypothetical protein [Prevotella sp.]